MNQIQREDSPSPHSSYDQVGTGPTQTLKVQIKNRVAAEQRQEVGENQPSWSAAPKSLSLSKSMMNREDSASSSSSSSSSSSLSSSKPVASQRLYNTVLQSHLVAYRALPEIHKTPKELQRIVTRRRQALQLLRQARKEKARKSRYISNTLGMVSRHLLDFHMKQRNQRQRDQQRKIVSLRQSYNSQQAIQREVLRRTQHTMSRRKMHEKKSERRKLIMAQQLEEEVRLHQRRREIKREKQQRKARLRGDLFALGGVEEQGSEEEEEMKEEEKETIKITQPSVGDRQYDGSKGAGRRRRSRHEDDEEGEDGGSVWHEREGSPSESTTPYLPRSANRSRRRRLTSTTESNRSLVPSPSFSGTLYTKEASMMNMNSPLAIVMASPQTYWSGTTRPSSTDAHGFWGGILPGSHPHEGRSSRGKPCSRQQQGDEEGFHETYDVHKGHEDDDERGRDQSKDGRMRRHSPSSAVVGDRPPRSSQDMLGIGLAAISPAPLSSGSPTPEKRTLRWISSRGRGIGSTGLRSSASEPILHFGDRVAPEPLKTPPQARRFFEEGHVKELQRERMIREMEEMGVEGTLPASAGGRVAGWSRGSRRRKKQDAREFVRPSFGQAEARPSELLSTSEAGVLVHLFQRKRRREREEGAREERRRRARENRMGDLD